uniref:Uncharacterized protein n=1 Tax=Romanomermis culicivorax TaxID=13658 RepID=A0A915K1V5_ROMCU
MFIHIFIQDVQTSTAPKMVHKPDLNFNTMCWTLAATEIKKKICSILPEGTQKKLQGLQSKFEKHWDLLNGCSHRCLENEKNQLEPREIGKHH